MQKKFFNYFFSTLKSGKYLLIKTLVTAVLYTIISVLTNLLAVEELTYLNAFLALNFFSDMIAFGFSKGVNIFIDQNISSKERVEKHIKQGFQVIFVFALLFTILLAIFPRFFMSIIAGLSPESYTFYYIMCIYFSSPVFLVLLEIFLKN